MLLPWQALVTVNLMSFTGNTLLICLKFVESIWFKKNEILNISKFVSCGVIVTNASYCCLIAENNSLVDFFFPY
jgi:hypothetical protein